jgi:hypothetical protein
MSIGLTYKDTIQLVKTKLGTDGYATEVIDQIVEVPALFIANTGWTHGGWQTNISSDAELYIDPTHEFVQANHNRLEGMLVIHTRYGGDTADEWYRIIAVIVGEDKLLGNTIDNINCQLKKTSEVVNVS